MCLLKNNSVNCLLLLDDVDDGTYLKYKANVMKLRNDIITGENIRKDTEEILEKE